MERHILLFDWKLLFFLELKLSFQTQYQKDYIETQ